MGKSPAEENSVRHDLTKLIFMDVSYAGWIGRDHDGIKMTKRWFVKIADLLLQFKQTTISQADMLNKKSWFYPYCVPH